MLGKSPHSMPCLACPQPPDCPLNPQVSGCTVWSAINHRALCLFSPAYLAPDTWSCQILGLSEWLSPTWVSLTIFCEWVTVPPTPPHQPGPADLATGPGLYQGFQCHCGHRPVPGGRQELPESSGKFKPLTLREGRC